MGQNQKAKKRHLVDKSDMRVQTLVMKRVHDIYAKYRHLVNKSGNEHNVPAKKTSIWISLKKEVINLLSKGLCLNSWK